MHSYQQPTDFPFPNGGPPMSGYIGFLPPTGQDTMPFHPQDRGMNRSGGNTGLRHAGPSDQMHNQMYNIYSPQDFPSPTGTTPMGYPPPGPTSAPAAPLDHPHNSHRFADTSFTSAPSSAPPFSHSQDYPPQPFSPVGNNFSGFTPLRTSQTAAFSPTVPTYPAGFPEAVAHLPGGYPASNTYAPGFPDLSHTVPRKPSMFDGMPQPSTAQSSYSPDEYATTLPQGPLGFVRGHNGGNPEPISFPHPAHDIPQQNLYTNLFPLQSNPSSHFKGASGSWRAGVESQARGVPSAAVRSPLDPPISRPHPMPIPKSQHHFGSDDFIGFEGIHSSSTVVDPPLPKPSPHPFDPLQDIPTRTEPGPAYDENVNTMLKQHSMSSSHSSGSTPWTGTLVPPVQLPSSAGHTPSALGSSTRSEYSPDGHIVETPAAHHPGGPQTDASRIISGLAPFSNPHLQEVSSDIDVLAEALPEQSGWVSLDVPGEAGNFQIPVPETLGTVAEWTDISDYGYNTKSGSTSNNYRPHLIVRPRSRSSPGRGVEPFLPLTASPTSLNSPKSPVKFEKNLMHAILTVDTRPGDVHLLNPDPPSPCESFFSGIPSSCTCTPCISISPRVDDVPHNHPDKVQCKDGECPAFMPFPDADLIIQKLQGLELTADGNTELDVKWTVDISSATVAINPSTSGLLAVDRRVTAKLASKKPCSRKGVPCGEGDDKCGHTRHHPYATKGRTRGQRGGDKVDMSGFHGNQAQHTLLERIMDTDWWRADEQEPNIGDPRDKVTLGLNLETKTGSVLQYLFSDDPARSCLWGGCNRKGKQDGKGRMGRELAHVRYHIKLRPFKCEEQTCADCARSEENNQPRKRFVNNDQLKEHAQRGENYAVCEHCSKKLQSNNLARHLTKCRAATG